PRSPPRSAPTVADASSEPSDAWPSSEPDRSEPDGAEPDRGAPAGSSAVALTRSGEPPFVLLVCAGVAGTDARRRGPSFSPARVTAMESAGSTIGDPEWEQKISGRTLSLHSWSGVGRGLRLP